MSAVKKYDTSSRLISDRSGLNARYVGKLQF
jgi:hypothetical protein